MPMNATCFREHPGWLGNRGKEYIPRQALCRIVVWLRPVTERPGVHTELSGDRAGVLGRVSVTRDRRLSKASPDPSKEGPADMRQP